MCELTGVCRTAEEPGAEDRTGQDASGAVGIRGKSGLHGRAPPLLHKGINSPPTPAEGAEGQQGMPDGWTDCCPPDFEGVFQVNPDESRL